MPRSVRASDPEFQDLEALSLLYARLKNVHMHILGNPVIRAIRLMEIQPEVDALLPEIEAELQRLIDK
jgi:hypothetical protein